MLTLKIIKEPKEIKSPNWLDKNKLKGIIDSNKSLTATNLVTKIK